MGWRGMQAFDHRGERTESSIILSNDNSEVSTRSILDDYHGVKTLGYGWTDGISLCLNRPPNAVDECCGWLWEVKYVTWYMSHDLCHLMYGTWLKQRSSSCLPELARWLHSISVRQLTFDYLSYLLWYLLFTVQHVCVWRLGSNLITPHMLTQEWWANTETPQHCTDLEPDGWIGICYVCAIQRRGVAILHRRMPAGEYAT